MRHRCRGFVRLAVGVLAAKAIGSDPVHFGVRLILKGGLGLITPPIGSVLFVGTAIGKISVGDVLRTIWPFYLAVLAVLLVVASVPTLSLWLPSLLRAATWEPTPPVVPPA
jgi:TRAP-type C4-dicarboxylate transport system permease large subunit